MRILATRLALVGVEVADRCPCRAFIVRRARFATAGGVATPVANALVVVRAIRVADECYITAARGELAWHADNGNAYIRGSRDHAIGIAEWLRGFALSVGTRQWIRRCAGRA